MRAHTHKINKRKNIFKWEDKNNNLTWEWRNDSQESMEPWGHYKSGKLRHQGGKEITVECLYNASKQRPTCSTAIPVKDNVNKQWDNWWDRLKTYNWSDSYNPKTHLTCLLLSSQPNGSHGHPSLERSKVVGQSIESSRPMLDNCTVSTLSPFPHSTATRKGFLNYSTLAQTHLSP